MKTGLRLIALIIALITASAASACAGLGGDGSEDDGGVLIFGRSSDAAETKAEEEEDEEDDTAEYSLSSYYAIASFDAVEGTRIKAKTSLAYSSQGYKSAQFTRTGKNLCPIGSFSGEQMYSIDLPALPAGVYTLSFDYEYSEISPDGSVPALVAFRTAGGKSITAWVARTEHTGHKMLRVASASAIVQIIAYSSNSAAASKEQTVSWNNIQLEALSHDTGYEPYTGEDHTVQFSEKVYGGEIDWYAGTVISRFGADGTPLTEVKVISFDARKVKALAGRNNVYCPQGDTSAEYVRAVVADDYDCDINFWGDSLTFGGLSVTFPSACAEALGGATYRNCGVGGEDSHEIAARMGAVKVYLPAPPAGETLDRDGYALGDIVDEYGHSIELLRQGNGGATVNPVRIGGQFCELTISQSSVIDKNATYAISGYVGETPDRAAPIEFSGSIARSRIAVIWAGTNDGIFNDPSGTDDKIDELIEVIDKMIEKADCPCLVLGLSVGNSAQNAELDARMSEHYGERFFNPRQMLCENGMALAGLEATEKDTAQLAEGRVPDSLRGEGDPTHLNVYGYRALGEMVAEKIRSLGWDELIG